MRSLLLPWIVTPLLGCVGGTGYPSKAASAHIGYIAKVVIEQLFTPPPEETDVCTVEAGEEWYQKEDASCPVASPPLPPHHGVARLRPESCGLLRGLACATPRRLQVPQLWRVRRAIERFPIECSTGTTPADRFTLSRRTPTQADPAPFSIRCPPAGSFPSAGFSAGGLAKLLEAIHAATGKSEYDYIEDAYRHLPQGDMRGDAIAMLVGTFALLAVQSDCTSLDVKEMSSVVKDHDTDPTAMLCDGGPFEGDRRFEGFQCTAFFVAPDYLVTAAHCVHDGVCKGVPTSCAEYDASASLGGRQILRHFARLPGTKTLAAAGVTNGAEAELIACEKAGDKSLDSTDWAVFRLKGGLPGKVLTLAGAPPRKGDSVHMLSHLANLPLKHSAEGPVRTLGAGKFEMEVDGFSGSSGAPIFNAEKEVVGIYVQQETPGLGKCEHTACRRLPICPTGSCPDLPRASLLDGVKATIAHRESCK